MQRLLTTLLLLAVFFLGSPLSAQRIDWQRGDLALLRDRAGEQDRLFFVFFTADWCMPCQWMDEHTWTNAAVVEYIGTHYLAQRLDYDQPSTAVLQQQFGVSQLPTLLIFATDGRLIETVETVLAPTDLLARLRAADTPAHRLARTAATSIPAEPVRPAPQPDLGPLPAGVAAPAAPQPVLPTTAATPSPPPPQLMAREVSSETPISAQAYRVEIIQPVSYSAASREAARLSQRYDQPATVQQIGEYYYVRIGYFTRASAAADFRNYMQRSGLPARIVQPGE